MGRGRRLYTVFERAIVTTLSVGAADGATSYDDEKLLDVFGLLPDTHSKNDLF